MADEPDPVLRDMAARIDTLETRIAYQDEAIEELNKVVVDQWARLDHVQRRLEGLQERIRELQDRAGPEQHDEPPPPHY